MAFGCLIWLVFISVHIFYFLPLVGSPHYPNSEARGQGSHRWCSQRSRMGGSYTGSHKGAINDRVVTNGGPTREVMLGQGQEQWVTHMTYKVTCGATKGSPEEPLSIFPIPTQATTRNILSTAIRYQCQRFGSRILISAWPFKCPESLGPWGFTSTLCWVAIYWVTQYLALKTTHTHVP